MKLSKEDALSLAKAQLVKETHICGDILMMDSPPSILDRIFVSIKGCFLGKCYVATGFDLRSLQSKTLSENVSKSDLRRFKKTLERNMTCLTEPSFDENYLIMKYAEIYGKRQPCWLISISQKFGSEVEFYVKVFEDETVEITPRIQYTINIQGSG